MRAALIATFLLFVACATEGAAAGGQTAKAELFQAEKGPDGQPKKVRLICTNEKSTGSNFSERVCRRVDDGDKQRAATQVEVLKPRAGLIPNGG